jgi:hypothetical protein
MDGTSLSDGWNHRPKPLPIREAPVALNPEAALLSARVLRSALTAWLDNNPTAPADEIDAAYGMLLGTRTVEKEARERLAVSPPSVQPGQH